MEILEDIEWLINNYQSRIKPILMLYKEGVIDMEEYKSRKKEIDKKHKINVDNLLKDYLTLMKLN